MFYEFKTDPWVLWVRPQLYLNVAESLEMMVFVEPYRAAILKSLGLPEQVEKLITSDPSRARIHVGSMGIASFKGAKLRLREHRSRFSNVVAIRPTGWTWKAGGENKQQKNPTPVQCAETDKLRPASFVAKERE